MATGYTAKIEKGQDFKEFLLGCACAFFYDCSTLPERFEPHFHRPGELEAKNAELEHLALANDEQVAAQLETEHAAALRVFESTKARIETLRARYGLMRQRVLAWQPPPQHGHLKDFALQQIDTSIEHDCFDVPEPIKPSIAEYKFNRLATLRADIAYIEASDAKQASYAMRSTEWVQQLRKSLA